jgi:hypothetical protein
MKDLKVELDVYGKVVVPNAEKWDLGYVASEDVVDLVENEEDEEWNDWGRSVYYDDYDDDVVGMEDEELPAIDTGVVVEGESEKEISKRDVT